MFACLYIARKSAILHSERNLRREEDAPGAEEEKDQHDIYTFRPRHIFTIRALRFVNWSIRRSISNTKKLSLRPVELYEINHVVSGDCTFPQCQPWNCLTSPVWRGQRQDVSIQPASQPETNLYRFTTAVLLHRIASLADCRFDALISPEPLHSYDLLFFIIYIYRYGEEQS